MAVRKLDDESSLLGLARDGSKTGLGILDMPGNSDIEVLIGDDTALSAARVLGSPCICFAAKWSTDILL